MAKTKPINPEKQPSVKERLTNIEKGFDNFNHVFAMYVDYNNDAKGFRRFLDEKVAQAKKQAEEKTENEKD